MKLWKQFCASLKETLGKSTCDPWLSAMRVVRFDARNVHLEMRDAFVRQWFDQHIRPRLKDELRSESGHPIKVHISIAGHKSKPKEKPQTKPQFQYLPDPLPDSMTFDNFISDSVALKLLQEPPQYNPIFLHGPAGSGKTHLLCAYAHANPGAFYVHAQTLTEHVINAMRTSDMDTFRASYRNVRALLIDDISILKGRSATQEEFFHTFNALHTAGVQIIISSASAPQELQGIENRLISRFEWGVQLPLEPPADLEPILDRRIALSDDAKAYVIKHFSTSSALTKAIDALHLRMHMHNIETPLTELKCAQLLSDLIEEQKKKALEPETIVKVVADYFGVTVEDLLGRSHAREYTQPRQIAMYLMRELLKMPYAKIGDHFGRDHSTVMTSYRAVKKHKDTVARALRGIAAKLAS